MEKVLVIEIPVKSKKMTKIHDDEFGKKGDTFYSYEGYSPKLGWCNLRLTKNCEVKEIERFATLKVGVNQISVDMKAKFPVIWISELKNSQVVYTDRAQNVADYFKE